MFRVSRPMLVVVLKAWVTEMKQTQCVSNSSTSLANAATYSRLYPLLTLRLAADQRVGPAALARSLARGCGARSLTSPRRRLPMDETVIAEYARQLMEAHGDRAIAEAAQRAVACERQEDKEGAETWRHVEAALKEMRGPRRS